jgi:hypothetical protein
MENNEAAYKGQRIVQAQCFEFQIDALAICLGRPSRDGDSGGRYIGPLNNPSPPCESIAQQFAEKRMSVPGRGGGLGVTAAALMLCVPRVCTG